MSDPQLSSDALSRLKARAELSLHLGKGTNADASMVLALVECAEVLRELRYTPVGDQPQAEIDAFWNRVHTAVDKLEAL